MADALRVATKYELGELVKLLREQKGLTQEQVAQQAQPVTSRTVVAHLEQGHAIPGAEVLAGICGSIGLPDGYWKPFTEGGYLVRLAFEDVLSELIGRRANLQPLDPRSEKTATQKIEDLFRAALPAEQARDALNSILVYYGILPIGRRFFDRYFTPDAFRGIDAFRGAIRAFQVEAIRLFSTFSEAFRVLARAEDMKAVLAPLTPRTEEELDELYRKRTEWTQIQSIPSDRLPDLGYISHARVRQEAAERQEVSTFLRTLAENMRRRGHGALTEISDKRRRQMDSLLTKFGASFKFSLSGPLFAPDPDLLEREADRLGPKKDVDLARMAETQRSAGENLANYLSADHLDIYVATSMRSDADFVSVNQFVEKLFHHDDVRSFKLRYFNPTLSYIDDRVAKGLVEALMLRRSACTIYMAQKEDTFGKDSEASVALGQGKPVIVYVPRLFVPDLNIDTESAYRLTRREREDALRSEAESQEDREIDETVDDDNLLGRLLTVRLHRATPEALAVAAREHWADFDLFGETDRIKEPDRPKYRKWLDDVVKRGADDGPPGEIRDGFIGILVSAAVRFERRARTFRETHPLALQVILSSGVLNGILVVRSVEMCAKILRGVVQNRLSLELRIDRDNYRLVETSTDSTIRVISKHTLILNAFETFYAPTLASRTRPL